jgi:prolyl oligopeptidase
MLLLAGGLFATPPAVKAPETRKCDQVDDYFGTKVPDPFRWLEDSKASDTLAWVSDQNRMAQAWLQDIPERGAIQAHLARVWDFEKCSAPIKAGRNFFYTFNPGTWNQEALFVTSKPELPGRILLDPNVLSHEGTVALASISPSPDGRFLAYGLSSSGSDWQVLKVRDVATGLDLPGEIPWCKYSPAAWKQDGSGFFYVNYDAPRKGEEFTMPNRNPRVWFHKLGTPLIADQVIYERPDEPGWALSCSVTEDGHWLCIEGGSNRTGAIFHFLKDLRRPGAKVEPFIEKEVGVDRLICSKGDTFFALTSVGARRNRLVAIRRGHTGYGAWIELIPQGDDLLQGVSVVGHHFVATWLHDGQTQVTLHDLTGRKTGSLALPCLGSAYGITGRRADSEGFLTFASFGLPPTVFRFDPATGAIRALRAPNTPFNPDRFAVQQVFFPSKDGTQIPMFLVHRRDLARSRNQAVLLYGYGGFGVSMRPRFDPAWATWLDMGGILAVPNLRGGGEYGQAWHLFGSGERKQNAFDDFIAAGEWLIANGYTSKEKIAINGGSNGGLLVGACLVQRPDLWGAAVPEVAVLDMLRFHYFTGGHFWQPEYGTSRTQEGFDTLYAYSPLHNLKAGIRYPPVLILTSDHDDRVVPAHSFKFAAALQAAQGGDAPILLRTEEAAGHGAGKPTNKQIQERTDVYAFLYRALGMWLPADF